MESGYCVVINNKEVFNGFSENSFSGGWGIKVNDLRNKWEVSKWGKEEEIIFLRRLVWGENREWKRVSKLESKYKREINRYEVEIDFWRIGKKRF